MNKDDIVVGGFLCAAFAFVAAAVIGWCWNIGKLFVALGVDPWSMQVLIRAIGVFLAPLGAVVGWF